MQLMHKILPTHLTPLNTNTANRKEDAASIYLFDLKPDSVWACVCVCVCVCVSVLCTDLEFLRRATNNPKSFPSSHGWTLQGVVSVCAEEEVLHLIRSLLHLQENNEERQRAGENEKLYRS